MKRKCVQPIAEGRVADVIAWPEKVGRKTIQLAQSQRFANPASTNRPWLYGPMLLEFERWADGGVTVTVIDGEV